MSREGYRGTLRGDQMGPPVPVPSAAFIAERHGLHVTDLGSRLYQASCQCGAWASDVDVMSAVVDAHRKHAREMEATS